MPFCINPKTPYQTLNQINQLVAKIGLQQLSDRMSIRNNVTDQQEDSGIIPYFNYQFYDAVIEWQVKCFINCSQTMKFSQILNRISHINFTNISIMCLVNCQITNLESFSWLGCQNQLKQLKINQNKISSLQPFAKCKFKNLLHLNLSKNNLSQMQIKRLSRCQLPTSLQILQISQKCQTYHDIDLRYVCDYIPVTKYSTTLALLKNVTKRIKHLDVECVNQHYSIPQKVNVSLYQRSVCEIQVFA